MADKNKYEDIHNQFSNAMQDLYLNDLLEDVKEPNVNLSFLNEGIKKKKRRDKVLRVGIVAAVAIIVLLGANIALLSSESINSYGDKGILHRLYEGICGIFTDNEENESTDSKEAFESKNESDIDKVKQIFPDLYIPQYIPKGYEFKSLNVMEYYSGDYTCNFLYENKKGDKIEIASIYYNSSHDYTYQDQASDEIITLPDRKILVAWEEAFQEFYATIYIEQGSIDVGMYPYNDKEKLIKIARNLEQ